MTGVTRLQASAQRGQAGATNVNPAPRPLSVRVESEAMRTKVVNQGRCLGCPRMNPLGRFFKAGYDSARESGLALPQREMETETGKSGRTRQPASQPPTGDVTETSRCVNIVISSFTCFYFNADSLLNKRNELRLAISQHQPMIICISEILPKNCVTQMSESELNIVNYKCFANLTSAKRGVCIYTHVSLSATECRMTTDCDESV